MESSFIMHHCSILKASGVVKVKGYLIATLTQKTHWYSQCCIMTLQIVRKATVTFSLTNTLKNLRAIYGHVSHRDDVTIKHRGSPFICRNVKTQSGCVLLWALQIDVGHADSKLCDYERDEQVKLRDVQNVLLNCRLKVELNGKPINLSISSCFRALELHMHWKRGEGGGNRERGSEKESKDKKQDWQVTAFVQVYWSYWKASCVDTMGKSGK